MREWTAKEPTTITKSSFKLDRKAKAPLYIQIKNHLKEEIQSAALPEGTAVPTEDELCAQYGVSKITVREALRHLVAEGVLERTRGKGTFVRRPKYRQQLRPLFSFTRWAKENGLEPSTRVVKIDTEVQDDVIASDLGISQTSPVVQIDRLRLADGEPLCYEQIYISSDLTPGIHLKDVGHRPFNEILATDYGVYLGRSAVTVESSASNPVTQKLLGLRNGQSVLVIRHKVFTERARVGYTVTCYYRGDKVRFSLEL